MSKVSSMIKSAVAAFVVVGLGAVALTVPATALDCAGANCAQVGVNNVNPDTDSTSLETVITTIINVVIYVIGLVAVVMIILGGVQYTTSQGEAAKVKKAKDTILYGIIGLVVAILAFAIVNFVLSGVFGTS
jgi:hypothetical protein